MSYKFARAVALVGLVGPGLALGQALECPPDPPPNDNKCGGCRCGPGPGPGNGPGGPGGPPPPGPPPNGPPPNGPPSSNSKNQFGDPVLLQGQSSWYQSRDLRVDLPVGDIWLSRFFSSSPDTWLFSGSGIPHASQFAGVPLPFGRATSSSSGLLWSHNFFSMVLVHANNPPSIRTIWGHAKDYENCTISNGFCTTEPRYRGETDRLLKLDAGFVYIEDDGRREQYEARFLPPDAGDRFFYFLSRLVDREGRTVATVSYQTPLLPDGGNCPGGAPGTDNGVPYVREVLSPSATLGLRFSWEELQGSVAGTECALRRVDVVQPDAGVGSSIWFAYDGNKSGRVIFADGGLQPEQYSYDGGFGRVRDGNVVSFHALNGNNDVVATAGDNLPITMDGGQLDNICCEGGGTCSVSTDTCCSDGQIWRRATYAAEGVGYGTSPSDPGLTTYWEYMYIGGHGQKLASRTDQCTSNDSCSPGTEYYSWLAPNMLDYPYCSGLIKESGRKDKRGNWFVDYNVVVTPDAGAFGADTGNKRFWETRFYYRGLSPNVGSANALEMGSASYGYTADYSVQRVHRMEMPSAVVSGADAGVVYRYTDGGSQADAVVRFGKTKYLDGGVGDRYVAYFYRTNRICEDVGSDPLQRVVSIIGPCEVSSESATSCSASSYPVTELHYYSTAETDPRAGRLKKVLRYPAGFSGASCGTGLKTEYLSYSPEGDPLEVKDENDVVTTYEYDRRRISKRTTDGKVWEYVYSSDQLISIKYPEGNYDVFCYKDGVGASGECTGNPTKLLQWTAKAGSSDGASWSEKAKYSWWPDDTIQKIEYFISGSSDVRREVSFAADAHQRPTWSRLGDSASGVVSVAHFDAADNRDGVGLGFNSAPTFCKDGASESKLCAWMRHDRANRLGIMDQYPDFGVDGGTTGVRTCLDHDLQGNINKVSVCTTAQTCGGFDVAGGSSTCSSAGADYVYDDFGNVVEATLPNTDNGSNARGVARYEYDAFGNMTRKQTEAMRLAGHWVELSYDQLGRLKQSDDKTASTTVWNFKFTYDSEGTPGTNCSSSNTKGRVRSRQDGLWTTWYTYDSFGRVTGEYRETGGSCGGRNTLYSWTDNGNLSVLTYPHGREVKYNYGSAGLKDRVASIQTKIRSGGAWGTFTDIVTGVSWEPYAGLRGYVAQHLTTSTTSTVEYMLGGDSTATDAGCSDAIPSVASGYDKTARLRSLRVTAGTVSMGSSTGNIYKRGYSWRGDQVKKIDTCYLDGGTPITEDYGADFQPGYDTALRLKSLDVPNFASSGGVQRQVFAYDNRGNRTSVVMDAGISISYGYSTASHRADLLTREHSSGSALGHRYDSDRDGRVTARKEDDDSGGTAGSRTDFVYTTSAGDTVFKTVLVDNAEYPGYFDYFYDAFNRRIRKNYPTDLNDDFYYDLSHQLLEDKGLTCLNCDDYFPLDEYIWLDGRPVVAIRSGLWSDESRANDFGSGSECSRWGEDYAGGSPACDLHHVVSDHIAKPVLVLDSSRRITGVGEYEPFGRPNRVEWWVESAHPYGDDGTDPYKQMSQPAHNMKVSMRVHYTQLDTEEDCNGVGVEGPSLWDYTGTTTMYTANGGFTRGDTWTDWITPAINSGKGTLILRFGVYQGNCDPGDCYCVLGGGGGTWPYEGYAMRDYEYRRFQDGATPYFVPLRFPGQYYDEETGLYENWNRFYEPLVGRYLQPEPLLSVVSGPGTVGDLNVGEPMPVRTGPRTQARYARRGYNLPTYAYALNNPVNFYDPNGLDVPVDKGWLKNFVSDLCRRFPDKNIRFRTTSNGGDPIDPNKKQQVKSWECSSANGTNGGAVGVDRADLQDALNADNDCKMWSYSP